MNLNGHFFGKYSFFTWSYFSKILLKFNIFQWPRQWAFQIFKIEQKFPSFTLKTVIVFFGHPLFSDNFKIKDKKQTEIMNILQNLLNFLASINISKCYSFSGNMAYFLAPIVNSSTSYKQTNLTHLQIITL